MGLAGRGGGYTWRSIAATGAVIAFGTDAPVEPFDPWPGIALAVRREDPRWPAGTPPFGPGEALTLERALRAACVGGPQSARETDRGRLTVGQRADVVVIPAAASTIRSSPAGRSRPLDRRSSSSTVGSSSRRRRRRRVRRAPQAGGPSSRSASANSPLKIRDVDGKAWIVSARTSIGTCALIATTHSWIAADASGQAIAAPTSSRDRPVHDDRHVPERRLDRVALGARREVGDELEGVEAGLERAVEREPDRRRLGVGVGRPRQRPVVRGDRLAERHPDRDLALVVRLVGVELGTGRVADDPQAVADAQPAVARERRPPGRVDAVVLEPEIVERERAPDGEQDRVTLAVEPSSRSMTWAPSGPTPAAPASARTPVRTTTPSRSSAARTTSELRGWSVGASRGPGLDDRRRHAEPDVDLGELAAGRAAAEDEQAARQLAGQRRVAVGPGRDVVDALERRHLRVPNRRR